MALVETQQSLIIRVRGQRIELALPERDFGFKSMHVADPQYEYEAVMASLLERMVHTLERPALLDIGAFIGYYSVLGGKLIGDRGQVWAIESSPEYADIIRRSVAINHLDNVEVVHTALSDRREPLRSVGRLVPVPDEGGDTGVPLQAETCDQMCARLGISPNIAKIDVHGFEGKIIAGMREQLRGSLGLILLELHPATYLEKVAPELTRMQILDWLECAGFATYCMAGQRRRIAHSGAFRYERMSAENRHLLLFDAEEHALLVASKNDLAEIIGPSAS